MDDSPSDATSGSLPKISVVVPTYNTEKYLRECVDSVLSQSFKDFELILVDDGSHDRCGEICDELARKDPRIRVFHQENGGVTSARRLGVGKAQAEWICFVDSDDLLSENALEHLFSAIGKFGDEVDLVEGDHIKFRENSETGERENFDEFHVPQDLVVNGLEYALGIVPLQDELFARGPWAKIIRKNLFEKADALGLPKWIFIGEDAIMNLLLATKIRVAVRVPKLVYNYRNTESSTFCRPENQAVFRSISYCFSLFKALQDLYAGLDENWQRVAKLFAISTIGVRDIVRRCDFSLLDNPAYKELLEIQKEEVPELPTKLFAARQSFPWKFLSNSVFKVVFKIVKEVCRPFE